MGRDRLRADGGQQPRRILKKAVLLVLSLATWPILGYMFLGGPSGFMIGLGAAIAIGIAGAVSLGYDWLKYSREDETDAC